MEQAIAFHAMRQAPCAPLQPRTKNKEQRTLEPRTKNKMKDLLITVFPPLVSAVVAFLLTRRKYVADVKKASVEVETNEIDNVEKAARIWRELSENITARLTADIEQLRSENQSTREKLMDLSRENNSLREQMAALEKELRATKKENEKLTEQLRTFNEHFRQG